MIFILIATTAICIANTMDRIYDRANVANNKNIYFAVRQQLDQQQQLQNEQSDQKFKSPSQNNYDENFQPINSYSNINNNNMEYNKYLQQHHQQNQLQNGLIRVKPQMMDEKSNDIAKRNSAIKEIHEEQEDGIGGVPSKINSELNEIFGELKYTFESAGCDECAKSELPNHYKVIAPKQDKNSANFHRRSPAATSDDSAVISTEVQELDIDLPYGIQNVRKRRARQNLDLTRSIMYQSLCPTKRTAIPLETSGYDYRPNHYIEVTCAHQNNLNAYEHTRNRVCSEAGFSCIQLNRTIHLIRRSKSSQGECWESEIRIVPSGCECMWPKHEHGDIMAYHGLHKRFGSYANEQANSDYEQGEGFRQIRPEQNEIFKVNGLRSNENADGVGFEVLEYPD